MAENIEEASALQADVNNTETGSVGVKPLVFEINRNAIESVVFENQPEELRALGLTIYDQSKFEEGVLRQVDSALEEQERVKKVKEAKHKIGPKKNDKSEKSGSHETPTLPTQREETQQDRLIRLGHMTPFGTILNAEKKTDGLTSFEKYLLEQENLQKLKKKESKGKVVKPKKDQPSATHDKNIAKPEARKEAEANNCIPVTSKRKHSAAELRPTKNKHSKSMKTHSDSDYSPSEESKGLSSKGKKRKKKETEEWNTDDSDWIYSDEETESKSSKRSSKKARMVDDGNLQNYKQRLTAWENDPNTQNDDCEEFEGGFKLPNRVWDQLYNYQKVGVRWMWELHLQKCGGILGDEMGLGKTVQAIAFLAGLSHSRLINHQSNYRGLGPVLLVTPATVMSQWVKEFHTWWPPLRVAILHDSGSHVGQKDSLIKSINHSRGVLITSYSGVVQHRNQLLARDWDYVILDEGHKIRNPDAQATLVVKQFRTCHRFICSGSPMQNNLKELWSLFDFIFPGKLGTLPVFLQQFAVPITHGGYANASEVQVATAFKCATILRDTIAPYLLRRMKADVRDHLRLPDKNEQVLFCQLTEEQRNLYKGYLASGDIKSIIDGRLQIFVGLTNLRKICNHPHLFASERGSEEDGDDSSKGFGAVEHSGKMLVIDSLLRIWNEQQHRVLLFSQSKQMLDILETFIQRQGYTYLRLDGTTSIGSRQPMIERYNSDPSIFVFLLTTRVGGLGVNLTGADRVVIYDPDWNPSTDTQARERAWRIGQKKNVTVYRLLTSGTIEEKIYHRQIFKQYLTNRVLKDPKQRRFFKSNDLYELFTLKEADAQGTETEAIFAGTGSEVATNHEAAERAQSSKTSDDDWMKNWQKERDKREAAWKKKLRLEQERTEAKSSNASSSQAKEAHKLRKKLKSERRAEKQKKLEVDGHKVTNVLKKSTYQPSEDQDNSSRTAAHDDYVLQRLFAKTGVVSALRHDSIVNAGDPDYVLVEGEAERVAQQAVQELKRSRRSCWNAQSGVPSWTGQNGVVRSDQNPAPAKPRFGSKKKTTTVIGSGEAADAGKATELPESADKSARLSSSDLLKRMQKRNRLLGVPSDRSSNEDARSSLQAVNEEETFIMGSDSAPLEFAPDVDYKTILDDLRSYVAFRGVVPGQVSTQDLLDEFNVKLPPRSAPIFRAFLKELCDFHRDVNGQGMWQLKPEFR